MKLASFDLEIAKMVEGNDWHAQRPLGISCAAIALIDTELATDDEIAYQTFTSAPGESAMTQQGAVRVVAELKRLADDGYTLLTVNGLGFDFLVLAEESGLWRECAELALNAHCDMMLMSVCRLGWPVGLDALAKGMGVQGKLHDVTLKDGSAISDMNGAKAPEMWQNDEREAVLAYLRDDVRSTLEIALQGIVHNGLYWRSRNGRQWHVNLERGQSGQVAFPTAAECLTWPRRDTSWMSDPLNPDDLAKWAAEALEK